MSSDELVARVYDTNAGYLALGNEVIDGPLACFVRNSEAPNVYDANHVTRVRARAPKEIDAVLARSGDVFAASGHRQFIIDPLTPPSFEARLVLEGYEVSQGLELVLEGALSDRGASVAATIRLVKSDDDWASVERLLRLWHIADNERGDREVLTEDVTRQVCATKRWKAPALSFFLASVKGVDCGFFSSWPGTNGVAKVEDLFTHPEHRHRGIATALLRHCVADARARGAREISIGARVDDTPKDMYAAMGFRPICVIRSWLKSDA